MKHVHHQLIHDIQPLLEFEWTQCLQWSHGVLLPRVQQVMNTAMSMYWTQRRIRVIKETNHLDNQIRKEEVEEEQPSHHHHHHVDWNGYQTMLGGMEILGTIDAQAWSLDQHLSIQSREQAWLILKQDGAGLMTPN